MTNVALGIPPELVDAIAERVAVAIAAQLPAPAAAPTEDGRLALRIDDAAEAIGVSVDHFERHVISNVRVIRSGRLRLIPHAELERWVSENAARPLQDAR